MSGPQAITIDGGPLGDLEVSGGVDGYGYVVNNTAGNQQSTGMNMGNGMFEVQKATGELQFTIEVGATSSQTLGTLFYDDRGHLNEATVNNYVTGPLYAGYVTLAPKGSPVTISVGQLNSLEGYEATLDYQNAVQFTSLLWYVQNSQARGVQATLTEGPVTASVQFGDGWDTGVWNTVQGLLSYTIDSNNAANVYGADNLGKTGPNTFAYGGGQNGLGNAYVNNWMVGAYYSFTHGNFNLVPEVQYQYAKTDHQIGIEGPSSNFGAALFNDYTFANTPYSIGSWIEYFDSHSSSAANYSWAIGPNAEAIGVAVAPTWQYKYLFARANAGYIYLLHNKDANGATYGYGNDNSKGQFTGTLEAGLLF
jgi:hypothetical protein